jgi:pyrroline-5-carboxylate reductase
MQLAVIGPGTMGLMAAKRLVETGIAKGSDVRCSRVSAARRQGVAAALPEARLLEDNPEAVAGADVVILAVKPKQFADVGRELQGQLAAGTLVISVMTGIALEAMSGLLDAPDVVRASSNIGIESGVSTTYWIGTSALTEANHKRASAIFKSWGDSIECGTEGLMDIAMVGVGSGPALVIEFIQAMTQAMVTEGMPRPLAEQGILSLLAGTAELARTTNRSLSDFQQSVITPGGITAEALFAMDEGKFRATIINAIRRAHRKAAGLGNPELQ